jgi:hypothetical protein
MSTQRKQFQGLRIEVRPAQLQAKLPADAFMPERVRTTSLFVELQSANFVPSANMLHAVRLAEEL